MKSTVLLLALILTSVPLFVSNLSKDKIIIFSSLSNYGSDFDGDKIADLSVWNPQTNTLYFQLTSDNKFYEKKFFDVQINYQPVFADYDGDGKTDFAFFHPDSGQWIINLSTSPGQQKKEFLGSIGDLPIPTNIDGDKQYEATVWRPSASAWLVTYRDKSDTEQRKFFNYGLYQDNAFSADYDGDGKTDLGAWRPDDGVWHIEKSSTDFEYSQSEHIQHGQEWDVIVPNDYDADGRCDLVLWRKSNQTWYFKYAKDGSQNEIKFGEANDIPASADIDGDGIPELITWNASKKTWNVLNFKKQESYSYKWNVPDGCLPAISILQKFE